MKKLILTFEADDSNILNVGTMHVFHNALDLSGWLDDSNLIAEFGIFGSYVSIKHKSYSEKITGLLIWADSHL